ncbi:MAG: HPr-rel-A system PqqD family peptide chaperone [Gemmatimonadota bacterium]
MTAADPNIRPDRSTPRGRSDVIFRQVGEEWLLFDPISGDIHVLNPTAALVWAQCDGATPAGDIAAAIREAFGQEAPPTAEVRALVMNTVEKFQKLGLLAHPAKRE